MKKIKSVLIKIKSKCTIITYQKPLYITLIKLLLINSFLLVVAAIVATFIDYRQTYFENFFEAFAFGSMKWMIAPNSILDYDMNSEIGLVILAAFVIAAEMILFSGVIIATLTTAIKNNIDKISLAKGKINLKEHFVILNWNNKVPDMICNLAIKNFTNSVIILSNKKKDYVLSEINSTLNTYRNIHKSKINLIVKEGNPLLHGDLTDISIGEAAQIVIMSREMSRGEDVHITNSDLNSLKILLTLGNFNIKPNCNIVVETETFETKQKIESFVTSVNSLKNNSVIPISFNRKLGQIIGQTVLNPRLANIYLELFSFEGSEFYSYIDMTIEDYLSSNNCGIPIINLKRLFVLARNEKCLTSTRKINYSCPRKLPVKEKFEENIFTVFIIGENKKSRFLIENLDLYKTNHDASFIVKTYSKNDIQPMIEEIKITNGYKKVLILSDDNVSDDSYDANVFVTLIALNTELPKRDNISYVTELLDSRNLSSVKDFNVENAIVSNRIMSLLLTQLALNKDSKYLYEGLLTVDNEVGGKNFDITIEKASRMLNFKNSDIEFYSYAELIYSFYYSFKKRYMLIGYIHQGVTKYIDYHIDEPMDIKIEKDDEFIFIRY